MVYSCEIKIAFTWLHKSASETNSQVVILSLTHILGKILIVCFFWKRFYLYLERGEGRKKDREGNINVWLHLVRPLLGTFPATQARALTGNPTCDPLVHRPALNPLSYTSQDLIFQFSFLHFFIFSFDFTFLENFLNFFF